MKNLLNTTIFTNLSNKGFKKQTIKNWSEAPCGSNYSNKKFGTKAYFQEIESYRYKTHPWIIKTIKTFKIKRKKVLEIGFGMGTDHLNLARQGAICHGIDLTPKNLIVTKKRFKLFRKKSVLRTSDAEKIPFKNNYFDFIYSFGVIHHSPQTEKIISEIKRVLKPKGKFWISVYHKNSIFVIWSTLIVNYILKMNFLKRSFLEQLSLIEYPNKNKNLVIRCYTKEEVLKMFNHFSKCEVKSEHLIPDDVSILRWFFKDPQKPNKFFNKIGKKLGWYLIAEGQK